MRSFVVSALTACIVACGGTVDGIGDTQKQTTSDDTQVTDDDPLEQTTDEDPVIDTPGDTDTPLDPPVEPPAGDSIPAVIAQGHMGRTMLTCDGGKTWVANHSDDDATRCWIDGDPHYKECDHDAGAGRGITWTGSAFLANFGWGTEHNIARRSVDGVAWSPKTLAVGGVGGINAAHGVVVAPGSGSAQVSTDDGLTYTSDNYAIEDSIRRTGYADYDGGRFLAVLDDGLIVSSDAGATWWRPKTWPSTCGGGGAMQTQGGIAYGKGVILIVGGSGIACRSLDGGNTWTAKDTGEQITSHLVWTGAAFYTWAWGTTLSSPDGVSWTKTAMQPELYLGPATYDPVNEIFVAVNDDSYASQRFYRSADGIRWTTLATSSFTGSHPIRAMAFGYVKPSAVCP